MKKIWLLVVFCAFNPLGACGDSSEKEISSENQIMLMRNGQKSKMQEK
ncbi:hypothetical protein CV093_08675 [Oceanobacillus sp. 143]|nr:hypothetical protein CV093_08675 [Oceanobacillus sp. 143]